MTGKKEICNEIRLTRSQFFFLVGYLGEGKISNRKARKNFELTRESKGGIVQIIEEVA